MATAVIRAACAAILMVGGAGAGYAQSDWRTIQPMPAPRSGASAVVLGERIYLIGGRDDSGKASAAAYVYDPAADSWQAADSLRDPRVNGAAVAFGGGIIAMGGRDDEGDVLDEVEFFDPVDRDWNSFSSLGEDRDGLTAVVSAGVMYAAGGADGNGDIRDDVERYDTSAEEWVEATDWTLDLPRASFASVSVSDSVFSFGGFNSFGPLDLVQRYHRGSGTASRRPLPVARGSLGAAALGDSIFIIGGRDQSNEPVARVDLYRTRDNTYRRLPDLNVPRSGAAVVAYGDSIFVFGGTDEEGQVLASVEVLDASYTVGNERAQVPADFRLGQNYPNPFSEASLVEFSVSQQGPSHVRLELFDVRGGLVAVLLDRPFPPGPHAVAIESSIGGRPLPSGSYVLTLTQGRFRLIRKILLVR